MDLLLDDMDVAGWPWASEGQTTGDIEKELVLLANACRVLNREFVIEGDDTARRIGADDFRHWATVIQHLRGANAKSSRTSTGLANMEDAT